METRLRTILAALLALLSAASAAALTVVEGSVEGTWTAAGSPYICTNTDLTVDNGRTLTIQPGVTVQFASGRRLQVAGNLSAVGTPQSPIIFTSSSTSPAAGAWRQIQFLNSAAAVLQHVEVRWAGQGSGIAAIHVGTTVSPTGSPNVAITDSLVSDCANFAFVLATDQQSPHTVNIRNCTVRNAGRGGVDVQSATTGDALTIRNNDFSGLAGPVVQVRAQSLLPFSASGDAFSGNLPADEFTLQAYQTFSKNVTLWQNLKVAPGSGGGPSVATGITLTVMPGVTMRFADSQSLVVNGNLTAAGTGTAPVRFSGMSSQTGSWGGIRFQQGAIGTLDHVMVEYAGGGGVPAILADGSTLSLSNSDIGLSARHGVEWHNADAAAQQFTVTACTIHDAASGDNIEPASGIRLAAIHPNDFVSITGNEFSGNDLDIFVEPSALPALNYGPAAVLGNRPGDSVWVGAGSIPDGTLIWESLLTKSELRVLVGSKVTFKPGSSLNAGAGVPLTVEGTLDIAGIPGQIVTMGGIGAQPGSWSGIRFIPGSTGIIKSAIVSNAGFADTANLNVSGASVLASGCAFLDGSGPGVSLSGAVTVSITGCLIRGNAGAAVRDTAAGVRILGNTATSGNDILSGGSFADTAVGDWQESRLNYWGSESGPYHPVLNPGGTGAQVSDHINFLPFSSIQLTVPVALLEPLSVAAQGTVPIYGEVKSSLLEGWTLEYGQGDPPAAYLPLASGTGNVENGLIVDWNTVGLNHQLRYTLRLTVRDVLGRSTQSVVVSKSPLGDITGNGLVEVNDAILTLRFVNGLGTPTKGQLQTGDVRPAAKQDGKLTLADVRAILSTAAGLYGNLP